MDIETLLTALGLSPSEAKIYRALADFNELSAAELAEKAGVKRTLIYHVTDRLAELGLVREFEKNKIKHFQAANPENLDKLIRSQKQKTDQMTQALENILPSLNQRYVSKGERPFVDIYTGVSGVEKINKAFLQEADEVLIFASPFLRQDKKMDELIRRQVRMEEQKGVRVRALVKEAAEELRQKPETRLEGKLIQVRVIPAEEFMLPGQIFIWKDTAAFSTVGTEMISTIIRNRAIAETFRLIFEALWKRAEPPAPLVRLGGLTGTSPL